MKTTFWLPLLLAIVIAGGESVRGETRTIAITVHSIKEGGGTLGSNSYSGGIEKIWTQDGVAFGGKAITEGAGNNAGALQMQASSGILYNTTPLPGKIVSIELHSTGTARQSSCYGGGASRLVNSEAASYTVSGGTQVGSQSATGWTADDFSGTDYSFFAIKRDANVAYLTSIVITCELYQPSVSFSPSPLSFGATLVGTPATQRLNIRGEHLSNDITLSITSDTAAVFSVPVATITAAEAMGRNGKNVDVVFTPEHAHSYGGLLILSSPDFSDTAIALAGTGGLPTISVDSLQVRFGKLAQGNSASRSIRITPSLLSDSISVSFADNASEFFSVAVGKLPYSRNTTLSVTYSPTAAGEHTATLRLQSGSLVKDIPLSGSAASLLLEENFAYEVGQKLTDNGWAAHSGEGTSPILVSSGLAFYGYAASGIGGAAAVVNNGEDVNRPFVNAAVTSGKIYMAFMFKTESTNSQGYFMDFAQVGSGGTISNTQCSRLYVSGSGEQIGISESGTAPNEDGAWLSVTPEVVYLGVVEFDFSTKQSNLYVFSVFPAAQPSSGYVTSASAANISGVGAVTLRQYNAKQRVTVDGIRIATSWEEAVKEQPIPPSFAEHPAVDTALITATTADVTLKVNTTATAKLYCVVKTAPMIDVTPDYIATNATDSA
ncbi:MAG: hypothetical protein LBH84_01385, partial [Prevotellaceae bacterium]|nr:hypothetical protein [Prevotellaceae bacterium]